MTTGADVVCTFTNKKLPKLIIQKVTKPAGSSTSFQFQVTGTGYTAFSLTGQSPNNSNTQTLQPGPYTAHEVVPAGWVLTGIGGSSDPNHPTDCTVTGSGGSTGIGSLTTQTVSVTLAYGDTVTCVFENTAPSTTRTQGFWATHLELAHAAWFGGTAGGHTFLGVACVSLVATSLCGRAITTRRPAHGRLLELDPEEEQRRQAVLAGPGQDAVAPAADRCRAQRLGIWFVADYRLVHRLGSGLLYWKPECCKDSRVTSSSL